MIQEFYDPEIDGQGGGEGLLAVVVFRDHVPGEGRFVDFLTDPGCTQQLAVIRYPVGHTIPAHVHREHERRVARTTEVLVVRSGSVVVDVFNSDGAGAGSVTLLPGDVVALLKGGHAVTFLADSVLVEVKQGPYAGSREKDKREL
jgi:hypothetical protein